MIPLTAGIVLDVSEDPEPPTIVEWGGCAAIMGYAEWGSRLAGHNSQPGAEVVDQAPVPRRGRGIALPYQP
jgi:hypothetical protein